MVDFNQINNYNLPNTQIQAQSLQALINKQKFLQQQKATETSDSAARPEISQEALRLLEQDISRTNEVEHYKNIAKAMMDEEPSDKVAFYKKMWETQGSIEVTDDLITSLASNREFRNAIG